MRLMSTVEIARLTGLSRQRIDQLSRGDQFPRALAHLAIGRVWSGDEIEAWARRTGRLGERSA